MHYTSTYLIFSNGMHECKTLHALRADSTVELWLVPISGIY